MKRALAERANKTADVASSTSPKNMVQAPLMALSTNAPVGKEPPPPSIHSDISNTTASSIPYPSSTPSSSPFLTHSVTTNITPTVGATNTSTTNTSSSHYASNTIINKRPRAQEPQSSSDKNPDRTRNTSAIMPPQQPTSQPTPPPPPPSSCTQGKPGRKRKKEENQAAASSDEDDEEQSSKAYFLQFQNKALASELYMLKHKIQKLEKEETEWKKTGLEIRQGVELLEREWRRSVSAVCGVLYSIGFIRQSQQTQDEKKGKRLAQQFSSMIDKQEHLQIESPASLLNSIQRIIAGFEPIQQQSQTQPNNGDLKALATSGELDLQNLQGLIDLIHSMSDQAETSIRDGITKWIQQMTLPYMEATDDSNNSSCALIAEDIMNIAQLHQQMKFMHQNVEAHQERIKELEKENEDAVLAEKRVRRGLYRIASGHLKIEEVMKDVENEDMGIPPLHDFDMKPNKVTSDSTPEIVSSAPSPSNKDDASSKSQISAELKQKMKELETVCEVRNDKIKELLNEKESLEKRVNELISSVGNGNSSVDIASLIPEQVQQTDTYMEVSAKLSTAERKITDLTKTIEDIRERWAVAKGECEHAKKVLTELNEKHAKRWKNLTGDNIEQKGTKLDEKSSPHNNASVVTATATKPIDGKTADTKKRDKLVFSKEITELEHKLSQALEGVRQVDALRLALTEANKLNDSLQSQVSEWKSKYTSLSSSKSASRSSNSSSQKASSSSGSTSEGKSSSSKSETSTERLKMDFRKCRKELMAEKLARENYKAKNERLEKERDSMLRANKRLIAQSTEKEEMNTKSLSSILQLNHLSELHAQEIETLQHKLKAVEQVALAARLTSNAKARLEEETKKEKDVLEQKMEKLIKELDNVKAEKEKSDARLDQSKSQLQSAMKDLEKVRHRCDELATESSSAMEERTKLMESLAVAKKEAQNSRRGDSSGRSRGSNGSNFTVDQLSTHLSVLKRRLACPVCNDRDKACILLRCRHMFCKHCVDENIKNRSRKCPACGQRFDMKDVADIWL